MVELLVGLFVLAVLVVGAVLILNKIPVDPTVKQIVWLGLLVVVVLALLDLFGIYSFRT